MDIFDRKEIEASEERAGANLLKEDLKEKRHSLKKTDEDIFEDFKHNLDHPFMDIIRSNAARYEKSGEAFTLRNRIVFIIETDSSAKQIYYNDGDVWRTSGEALITKYLKEIFPGLIIPRMEYGVKGEQLMLDAYPDHFDWIREERIRRANKKKEAS